MHDGQARPATPVTWLVAAIGAAACAAVAQVGADARWLAALGGAIVRLGAVPHEITYAAAPSVHWHDAPALGQLVFHGLESTLGDRGLVVAQVAAVSAALVALVLDLQWARARDGAAALVLVAVFAALPAAFLVVRAELYSLALFPVLVLLLRSEGRRSSRRLWLCPPLLALWANLHGGVLVGFAILAAFLVFQRARRSPLEAIGLLVASFAALFATPELLHSASYYAGVLHGEAAAERYGMWAPLSLRSPLDLVFAALALPLLVAALRRPARWELVVLAALALLSVEARRNGVWLVLFAATPAARSFGAAAGKRLVSGKVAAACCAIPALIAIVGFARPPLQGGAGESMLRRAATAADGTPILAEPLVAEQLAVNGSRIWIGNPLDAFSRPEQRLYLDWLRGEPDGDALLRDGRIRVVLVQRGSEPQQRLATRRSFREIARDARTVLYSGRG